MKKIRITMIMLLAALMALAMAGCGDKAPYTRTGDCMDTSYEITIYDEEMESDTANQILDDAAAEVERIDGLLNHKLEGSDVYKVNNAKGERVEVSQEVRDMMSMGILIGNMTDGAFDMTMGPVNDLWSFDTKEPKLPDDADIKAALEHVFYGDMATQGSQLWLADPEAKLDFTYMADSYIASKVETVMSTAGVKQGKIDIGGTTLMIGEEAEDTPWTVGIENINGDEVQLVGSIRVTDKALATISINEKTFLQNDKTYHHVLDPKTGYPAETDIESATVIASNGYARYCSILSATCILLGNTEAQSMILDLAQRNPDMELEAVFLLNDGTVYKTDGVELITE